jgi:hypothetical protein
MRMNEILRYYLTLSTVAIAKVFEITMLGFYINYDSQHKSK